MTELHTGLITSLSTEDSRFIDDLYDELRALDEAGRPLLASKQANAMSLLETALSDGAYVETGSRTTYPSIAAKVAWLARQLGISVYALDVGTDPLDELLSSLDSAPMRTHIVYEYPSELDDNDENDHYTPSPVRKFIEAQRQTKGIELPDHPAVELVHRQALYIVSQFSQDCDDWPSSPNDEWQIRHLIKLSTDSAVTFALTDTSQINLNGKELKLTNCSVSVSDLSVFLTEDIAGIPESFAALVDETTRNYTLAEATFNRESSDLEDFVTNRALVESALMGTFDTATG